MPISQGSISPSLSSLPQPPSGSAMVAAADQPQLRSAQRDVPERSAKLLFSDEPGKGSALCSPCRWALGRKKIMCGLLRRNDAVHRFGGKSCQAKATPGAHRSNLVNFISEQQTCKSPSKGTSKVPGSELDVVSDKENEARLLL